MTSFESMKAKFDAAQTAVDIVAQEIAAHRVTRAALADRGTAAANEIKTLEAAVTQTLMSGGDVGSRSMGIAALTAEVAACRTVTAQLDAKIADAERILANRHNNLNQANEQMLRAEYAEIVQVNADGIKALLPQVDRMAQIAPLIGTSLNPGQGWFINRRDASIGNIQIKL